MSRDFGPCLCGDPACGRCFPQPFDGGPMDDEPDEIEQVMAEDSNQGGGTSALPNLEQLDGDDEEDDL